MATTWFDLHPSTPSALTPSISKYGQSSCDTSGTHVGVQSSLNYITWKWFSLIPSESKGQTNSCLTVQFSEQELEHRAGSIKKLIHLEVSVSSPYPVYLT